MSSLFTIRSPLYIQYPNGEKRLVQELFQHPDGILYFEHFWEKDPEYSIHIIKGKIIGKAPWKVGDCVFNIVGCNHTHPELCHQQAFYKQETLLHPEQFRTNDIIKIACEKGAILPDNYVINNSKYSIC